MPVGVSPTVIPRFMQDRFGPKKPFPSQAVLIQKIICLFTEWPTQLGYGYIKISFDEENDSHVL